MVQLVGLRKIREEGLKRVVFTPLSISDPPDRGIKLFLVFGVVGSYLSLHLTG